MDSIKVIFAPCVKIVGQVCQLGYTNAGILACSICSKQTRGRSLQGLQLQWDACCHFLDQETWEKVGLSL